MSVLEKPRAKPKEVITYDEKEIQTFEKLIEYYELEDLENIIKKLKNDVNDLQEEEKRLGVDIVLLLKKISELEEASKNKDNKLS